MTASQTMHREMPEIAQLCDASHRAHQEINDGQSYVTDHRAILGFLFAGFQILIGLLIQIRDQNKGLKGKDAVERLKALRQRAMVLAGYGDPAVLEFAGEVAQELDSMLS